MLVAIERIPLNPAKFTDNFLPQLIHYSIFVAIILLNNTPPDSLHILTKFTNPIPSLNYAVIGHILSGHSYTQEFLLVTMSGMKPKERPSSYKTLTISKKLEILNEADVPGVSLASIGRKHQVSPSSIRSWRKNKDKLMEEASRHHSKNKHMRKTV